MALHAACRCGDGREVFYEDLRDQLIACAEACAGKGRPAVPFAGEHIWRWFVQLSGTRHAGMSGPLPISFTEIAAWASLMKTEPWDWEIATICRMDAAFLAVLAGKAPISADAPVSSVDATDGREVIGFMRAMAARKKS